MITEAIYTVLVDDLDEAAPRWLTRLPKIASNLPNTLLYSSLQDVCFCLYLSMELCNMLLTKRAVIVIYTLLSAENLDVILHTYITVDAAILTG